MTGINHKQAQRYLRAAADGLIRENQRALLNAHLRECDSCRSEADELNALEVRLKKNFQARWDANDGPSMNVTTTIQSRSRRIIMTNRINRGFKTLGGLAFVLAIGLLFNFLIGKVQNPLAVKSTDEPVMPQSVPSIRTGKSNGEWIAFIGGRVVPWPDSIALDITQDIFLIHPDGSGLMNLTNNQDHLGYGYSNLQWSPNGEKFAFLQYFDHTKIMGANQYGSYVITDINTDDSFFSNPYSWSPNSTQIAFADSSSGNYDIYTVYADGRDDPQLTQLTNDPGQDVGFVWSPDGSQIAYETLDGNNLSIFIMSKDGSNQREVAQGSGKVNLRWSLDGTSIYASSGDNGWLDCEACVHKPGIYRIYLNGSVQVHQIHYEQDASKVAAWYLYDTPQNTLYFMRMNPPAFLEFWGTWMQADGNSVRELGEMDPHQTCKTTTGNSLNEHISPDERFSIISNFCAGGFDLYLADREALNPDKKLVHLLRLPLNTLGQGGNNDTLPIRWSPDGRWLIYDDGGGTTYLLDIEKAMQDPAIEPTILIQPKLYTELSGTYQSPDFISVFELAWQPSNEVVENVPVPSPIITPQETSRPFRFGVPVESKEHALIAAQSGLRTAYRYAEPLTVITVEQLSYREYAQRINQSLNSPADLPVWFIVYYSSEWQSTSPTLTTYINDQGQIVPFPTNMVPSSKFRGCVYMAINANDGSPVEVGGALQQGIIPECNY